MRKEMEKLCLGKISAIFNNLFLQICNDTLPDHFKFPPALTILGGHALLHSSNTNIQMCGNNK